jgi:cyclopropane-fatty-acyl-phospholipid synthase
MLRLTVERAELADGMQILELGCGWGSLSLWMAEQLPLARITAVSNSRSQKAYIDQQAQRRRLNNLEVITANIADFQTHKTFDRCVSVEMFEHVRNHDLLLGRIADWLKPDGCLFVHIFCHRELTYLFETEGRANWMGRHFFTGGMMPSANWLRQFHRHLQVQQQWQVNGTHYQRTCEAWLQRLDAQKEAVIQLFQQDMNRRLAARQFHRWRIFFMACAELFGYHGGEDWFVSHYRFSPTPGCVAEPTALTPS